MRRLVTACLLATACQAGVALEDERPTTLRVEAMDERALRSCDANHPLLEFADRLSFRVEAYDAHGMLHPYNGPVAFRMAPGRMEDPSYRATMVDGVIDRVSLDVRLAFGGKAHIWAELVGEGGALATGVSPDLCFKTPKISDVQVSDSSHKTAFEGEQVAFRGARLVATGTDTKGFFVSDLDAPEYGSIYVFTFGNPTGVKPGSCLCEVSGAVKEFLHFTEIVFPTWRVFHPGGRAAAAEELEEERIRVGDDEVPDPREDESIIFERCVPADEEACSIADPWAREDRTVPKPVRLDPNELPHVGDVPWSDRMKALDRHEASLVAIGPLTMPTYWENCDYNRDGEVTRCFSGDCSPTEQRESDCTDACARTPGCLEEAAYHEFGQWGVTAEGGRRLNLLTRSAAPDLEPVTHRPGETIHCVVGNLRQIAAAPIPWVVQPRRPSDIFYDPPPPGADDPCAEP